MGSKEGIGVQRKLKSHIGWAFGRILGMAGRIYPAWSLTKLGMGLAFVFGMMFGMEKWLSSSHSRNSI